MEEENKGKKLFVQNFSKTELRVFLGFAVILILLPILFTQDYITISFSKNTAELANNLAGIKAPFLSFFGSVLVYLALKSQIRANHEIKKQFEQQNQDYLFFRLVDTLHDRIKNYSIDNPDKNNFEIKSYGILSHLVVNFKKDIDNECIDLGRHLMTIKPELINVEYYARLLAEPHSAIKRHEGKDLRDILINEHDTNKRWEIIKTYINGRGYENTHHASMLKSIGHVYFYKCAFEDRSDIYHGVYQKNYQIHGSFFDGYFNNLKYVLKYIDNIKENAFYIDYLKSNITSYEKAFIYYYLASNDSTREFKDLISKFDFISDLQDFNSFFIDIPSREEFKNEVQNFLKAEQQFFY